MPTPETHEEAVVKMVESSDLPAWAITSTKRYLRRARASAAADELDRQADKLGMRIASHGAGFPHGSNEVCVRCETWRLVASGLRARALELRKSE